MSNLILYLFLFICVSFVSCNDGPQINEQQDDGPETGAVLLQIDWPDRPTDSLDYVLAAIDCDAMNVASISAEVYSDSKVLLRNGGPWACSEGHGTISQVPAGDNHIVRLYAYDTSDNEVYRGEARNISVQDDQTAYVDVAMADVFSRTVSLVEDLNPGAESSFPHRLVEMQNQLYFIALDLDLGFELFTVEDAADSAQLLQDIYPIDDTLDRSGVMAPSDFVELNGWLYFRANSGNGFGLWRTDGTTANTEPIATSASFFNPTELTVLNNQIFFAADSTAAGRELWVFDEDSGQAQQVADIRPGQESSNPHELTTVGNHLYFVANNGEHGNEVWRTVGTAITAMVSDLYSGAQGSYPRNLVDVNGRLFFIAKNGSQNSGGIPATYGSEVWMIYNSGDDIVTNLLADLNATGGYNGSSNAKNLTWIHGTTLAFSAYEPNTGKELYLYDWENDSAPRRITDLNPGAESSYPANFVYLDGNLYFTAHNGNNVEHLWAYSLEQSQSLRCLTTALEYPSPRGLTGFNQTLYFTASHESSGRKLWATDGTRTGLVVGSNGGEAQHSPSNLMATEDRLYYTAFETDHGEELFRLLDQ